jgi:Flp pilus assembly protein TadD
VKLHPQPKNASPRRPGWPADPPARLISLLLLLVTVLVYLPVGFHDFINFDDPGYVSENPIVQNGLTWAGLKWAFVGWHDGNWHPLTWLSHELDCQLFGLNAGAHHWVNMLFHAANAVLLFQLWRRLTHACWPSACLAALFAWHPVHVESVAWVAERKDVLSTFFGLWSLWFYARYAQGREPGREKTGPGNPPATSAETQKFYWLAWGFLALGLLSKPMLVTWPFVLLLLDYWPLGRLQPGRWWALVREKIPFFALVVGSSVATFLIQRHGGAMMAVETMPPGARIGNALISYCRYLGKLFWPTDLAIYYPYPGDWPTGWVLLAGVFLAGVTALCFMLRRRHPYLLMGWLWYGGTLVPVIGLVQVGNQAMADRYTYIPSVGVFIMVIWGAAELTRCRRHRRRVWFAAGAAVLLLCLALTRQQLGHWRNSETLFRHALAVTENNWIAHLSLGMALIDQGQTEAAVGQFQATLSLKPNYAEAHNDLGNAFAQQGRTDDAISQYQAALQLDPADVPAHNNLGFLLAGRGQMDAAIRQYQEALRLDPEYAQARINLGAALDQVGRTDEAISEYLAVLRLQPDNIKIHNNLGIALARKGQWDAAISQFQTVLRLAPDNASAQGNLARAQAFKNQSNPGSQ